MMKKTLLLHYDNVPQFDFGHKVRFNARDNVNHYISTQIIPKINEFDIDVIFIKDSLSENYLSLYGLMVAHHVRLSRELGDKRYLPIVILSDLDGFSLNRFSQYGRILLTKGVYLIANKKSTIKSVLNDSLIGLDKEEFNGKFLEIINVEKPEQSNTHDIANEWAIYRWSEYIKADSKAIKKNNELISSMLYFKYLISKYPLPKKSGIRHFPKAPTANAKYKILYIDDEWAKGWSDVFEAYFAKSRNIAFETFEYEYKDKKQSNIIEDAKRKIEENDPDLVMLDLRLSQSDHNNQNIEDLTGMQLINKIKKINRGMQIIMLSATNKSLTLEKMYKRGILGYIKKDRPGDAGLGVKENYERLKMLVEDGVSKKYLKEIWEIQQEILQLEIFEQEEYDSIRAEIDSIFEILDSNMSNKFSFAVLSFTKTLEGVSSLFIDEFRMRYLKDNTSVGIYNPQTNTIQPYQNEKWHKNIENRLHNIMHKKLNITDRDSHKLLCELINHRNYIAHPKERTPNGCELIKNPDENKIFEWFGLASEVLKRMDENKR